MIMFKEVFFVKHTRLLHTYAILVGMCLLGAGVPIPLVAQTWLPCATSQPDDLPPEAADPNQAARMGASCRGYLYGTYGGSCTYTDCNVPPLPNPSCPNYRVPVVITVFRTNSGTSLFDTTNTYIKLAEANTLYAEAGIQLVMARSIRYINDSDLYNFVTGGATDPDDGINDDDELDALDLPNVLNIYVTNALSVSGGNSCGYAYFPSTMTSGPSVNTKNRAVLARSCMISGLRSLEHEIGHYFGLYHTHNGASGNVPNEASNGSGACNFGQPNSGLASNDPNNPPNKGDGIADTPPDPLLIGAVNNSCQYVGGYVPHPSQPIDTHNIMAYSNDAFCQPMHFSDCQLRKINDCLLQCRDYLCADNVAIDFASTVVNDPQSPYWEVCVGAAVPNLQAINNCYNWYVSATATTALASGVGSFTPNSIVNTNVAGTYEVWLEDANSYSIDRPCRRRAIIKVLPNTGTAVPLADNSFCCNQSISIAVQNAYTTEPYTVGFWVDTTPITNGAGLAAAQAAGKIFAADANLSLPANQSGWVFSPNCSANFAPNNYYVTPFVSYATAPAPQFVVGPSANLTIPDFPNTNGLTTPISVSQLPTNARLLQLCLFVQHPFTNDLNISLVAPSGTAISVVNTFSLTGAGVNLGTAATPMCFVTSGGYNAGACNGSSYPTPPCYVGNVNSDTPLNTDVGNPNGTWQLVISDKSNAGTPAKLQFAQLIFDQAPIAYVFPSIPTVSQQSCLFGAAIPITIEPENCDAAPPQVNVRLKAFLEGAYVSGSQTMLHNLSIPLQQPYQVAPWNYSGAEAVSSLPPLAIDWVLVEARDVANPNLVLDRTAAWLLNNGSITDYENPTEAVRLDALLPNQAYRIVLRHRNHLALISPPITLTDQVHSNLDFDFSSVAIQSGNHAQQNTAADGRLLMQAGDTDANGIISAWSDYNIWLLGSGTGYRPADLNLDGTTNASDLQLMLPNISHLGAPEIRY